MKSEKDDDGRKLLRNRLELRKRKLVLSKEELRQLQTIDKEVLAQVAGGRIVQSLVDNC